MTTPQLTLGSTQLNVLFSGLSSGFAGLYQVNARMPSSLPSGTSAQLALTDVGLIFTVQLPLQ